VTQFSTSDLTKLFIALGEQVRAVFESPSGSLYAGTNLVEQFNELAKAANELEGIKIALIAAKVTQKVPDLLAQIDFAIQLLTMRGDSSAKLTRTDAEAQAIPDDAEAEMQKPRVFIGCSVEGLKYAKIIQLQLARGTHTTIWNQGVFGLSRGTLETLVAERLNYDYAILVLTPDDTRIKRDNEGPIPRDNVIFELGLFMGALGRDRVFMVVKDGTELPTDLAGITPASFSAENNVNIVSTLGPVATMLEIAMGLL
jgi:predicted nucleotide-binding protein